MSALVPALIALCAAAALLKRVDLYTALTDGAMDGLRTSVRMLAPLIVLLTAVKMLRASGALGALEDILSPLSELVGLPEECLPIALIRPLSGSGALAVAAEVISSCGADSLAGRTAAVMLGSTETTFYVITVYFSAASDNAPDGTRQSIAKKSRRAIPAALAADVAGLCSAALFTRLFF